MTKRTNTISHRTVGNLMQDMENSAKASSAHLDKIYRDLAKKGLVSRGLPKTILERNNRIYAALGFIPSPYA